VKILKGDLASLDQRFELIMMHHAFEHVPDPLETLGNLKRLLRPNRFLIMRIPVAASYGWRKYRVNWVLLDAPRHLFLHTIKSMMILADAFGLELADVQFDSDGFTFWGSEQYVKDITLMDSKSYFIDRNNSMFRRRKLQKFEDDAARLNEIGA
jgi:SAM-dependent methyltransferase